MGDHRVRFGQQLATVPKCSGRRPGLDREIGPRSGSSEIARCECAAAVRQERPLGKPGGLFLLRICGRLVAPDAAQRFFSGALQSRDPASHTVRCNMGPFSAAHSRRDAARRPGHEICSKKKAARFPKRPFLSYDGCTFHRAISELPDRGPISRSSPGRRPLHFGTVANCCPNRTRWSPISVRWDH